MWISTSESGSGLLRSGWFGVVRRRPALLVVLGFAGLIAVGTLLLTLPLATEDGAGSDLVTALFTATSAVCVTGLIVEDTPAYWSTFGELTILGLIQLGGLGIMTLASLLGLLVFRRLGLRMRLTAQTETKALSLGDVRRVVGRVIVLSLAFECLVSVALVGRLLLGYGKSLGDAIYEGVFHAVSAFNNAGFSLYSDSLIGFVDDPWFCLPIVLAVVCGGIGFPVWLEIGRLLSDRGRLSMHFKITVGATLVLLPLGTIAVLLLEWSNPDTFGPLDPAAKLLASFVVSAMTRTAGFNNVDVGEMGPATLLIQDILMFIGGGSAGTAGGIKITTFAVLAFVILAEIRGEPSVHILGRKLPEGVARQALTVALMGVAAVTATTLVLLVTTPFGLDRVLFEAVSAFGTVGLSTGITPDIPPGGQVLLTLLMFLGRLGPITLASALALRERARRYELPEERPIVG